VRLSFFIKVLLLLLRLMMYQTIGLTGYIRIGPLTRGPFVR